MADKLHEQLSALVDGECSQAELQLALRRLAKDEALRSCWQRYHLIGDALRNNFPDAVDADFCARMHAVIAAEADPIKMPAPRVQQRWLKPVAGLAVAASVILVLAVSFNSLQQPDSPAGPITPIVSTIDNTDYSPAQSVATTAVADNSTVPITGEPNTRERIKPYVVNHNGFASVNGVHGILSYVHAVSYNGSR